MSHGRKDCELHSKRGGNLGGATSTSRVVERSSPAARVLVFVGEQVRLLAEMLQQNIEAHK